MKKNSFFNFKEKNVWDIGWPCSPRVYCLCAVIIILIISSISLTSCSRKTAEICDGCKYPFVVGKIEYYNEKMSTYYADIKYNGSGNNFMKSRIILPSRMFNIGDTIRPTIFVKPSNDTIK